METLYLVVMPPWNGRNLTPDPALFRTAAEANHMIDLLGIPGTTVMPVRLGRFAERDLANGSRSKSQSA